MKIILISDVSKLGVKGDIREVSNGYATNFLFPRRLAKNATPEAVSEARRTAVRREEERAKRSEELEVLFRSLGEKNVTLGAQANAEGHLFSGIHEKDIAAVIEKETGHQIPENAIKLEGPIKEIGTHTIELAHGQHRGSLTLSVVSA